MGKFSTAALVSSILIAGALPAAAADLPVKAQPMAPIAAAYNWTGCYIGGNVGGGWVRDGVTWTGIREDVTAFAVGAATVVPAAANADYTASGFVGGGQIGCNYQFNTFLLGAEVDAQYTGFRGSRVTTSVGTATIVPGTISESFESNWLATFRGRAGFVMGPALFY